MVVSMVAIGECDGAALVAASGLGVHRGSLTLSIPTTGLVGLMIGGESFFITLLNIH